MSHKFGRGGMRDARQMINNKLRQKDARDVILSKQRRKVADARGIISGRRRGGFPDARAIINRRNSVQLPLEDHIMILPKRTVSFLILDSHQESSFYPISNCRCHSHCHWEQLFIPLTNCERCWLESNYDYQKKVFICCWHCHSMHIKFK